MQTSIKLNWFYTSTAFLNQCNILVVRVKENMFYLITDKNITEHVKPVFTIQNLNSKFTHKCFIKLLLTDFISMLTMSIIFEVNWENSHKKALCILKQKKDVIKLYNFFLDIFKFLYEFIFKYESTTATTFKNNRYFC
jgi:hypothetical protein